MIARLTYEGLSASPVSDLRIPRGKTVTIELQQAPAGLIWPGSPDEQLDIKAAPDGRSAEITAKTVGNGTIEIQQGVGTRPLMVLRVQVYKDTSNEAVGFDATVGPEVPE